jgi:alkanesulfonate monooxygenase SsuD/methylene tetrahydromethanopterin reductase-like flavin-dependent oxidoreductase (luciferase family)
VVSLITAAVTTSRELVQELTFDAAGRLMEEIELANQVRLDVFAVGEHHRPDDAESSPSVVLAAGAARTRSIQLGSAVTVLSSDDPIRHSRIQSSEIGGE